MHFRDLAAQAAEDGAISSEEILELRRAGWSDGSIQPAEADAIFAINDHIAEPTVEWTDFFVEALSEFIIAGGQPRGYVTDEQAEWLIARIDSDGRLDSMAELELLAKVLDKASNAPEKLKAFALAEIEQAVLTGTGPTRGGGSLEAGCISEAEARLIRRFIFAQAGDRPAAVSRGEAEMLFRLKDAALGAANAPEWKRLFVQGVGNYLQGFGGHEALSNERAAELEHFMNHTAHGIGSFFGRMAKSTVSGGFDDGVRQVFGRKVAERDIEAEAAQAHEVTSDEKLWLQGRIDADGEIDEYEQALLDFLAEG
jgi:hypothetical protein